MGSGMDFGWRADFFFFGVGAHWLLERERKRTDERARSAKRLNQ